MHLTALPEPRYPADAATLSRVVAAAFNQRRKMLRASLKGLSGDPRTLAEGDLKQHMARAREDADLAPLHGDPEFRKLFPPS